MVPLCVYDRWLLKLSVIVKCSSIRGPKLPCVITIIISSLACAVIDVVVIGTDCEREIEPNPSQLVSIPKVLSVNVVVAVFVPSVAVTV